MKITKGKKKKKNINPKYYITLAFPADDGMIMDYTYFFTSKENADKYLKKEWGAEKDGDKSNCYKIIHPWYDKYHSKNFDREEFEHYFYLHTIQVTK